MSVQGTRGPLNLSDGFYFFPVTLTERADRPMDPELQPRIQPAIERLYFRCHMTGKALAGELSKGFEQSHKRTDSGAGAFETGACRQWSPHCCRSLATRPVH